MLPDFLHCHWVSHVVWCHHLLRLHNASSQGITPNSLSHALTQSIVHHLDVSGCIWMYLDVSECIWMYLDVSGCIWMYLNVSECIWMYLNVSGRIWVHPEGMWMHLFGICEKKRLCANAWENDSTPNAWMWGNCALHPPNRVAFQVALN